MMRTLTAFFADDFGFVISAELVLVLTIAVLSMIVGLHEVAVAVNTELNDISNAIGVLNQSFSFCGFTAGVLNVSKTKSFFAGSAFVDTSDDCDCNTSCDLVCATPIPENGVHL